MKTSVFFSGILSCLLLMSSCQKDIIDTSSSLSVGAEELIQMESNPSEVIIPISSSEGQWVATSNADWLEARQAGNLLVLNAQTNETLSVRKAQVLIVSSGIKKTIQVEQAGYPTLVVETDPTEITFSEEEGQMRLLLRTNATNWTIAKPAEDWIEVVSRPRVGELVVKVKANETTDARMTNIGVSANGQTHNIKVKQVGKLHFFLAFSDWGEDFTSVQKRELLRKSKLAATPNPETAVKDYTFFTVSKVFQRVRYEFEDYGSEKLQATTIIGDKAVPYTNEFHEFLVEQGFERITPLDGRTRGLLLYVHKEKKIDMSIYTMFDKIDKRDISVIFCRPIVEQPTPAPTFPSLEMGILRFGEATSLDVQEWEKNHGGDLTPDLSRRYGLPLYFAEDPFYARGYFFDKQEGSTAEESKLILSGYIYFFLEPHRAVYTYGDMEYLTKEFKDLLAREGFEFMYFYPTNRGYYYKNTSKNLNIVVRTIMMGPRRLLRINYQPLVAPNTSSVQAISSVELGNSNKLITNITNIEL